MCTAWKRKGYTIDGCIHHLAGASPKAELYTMWEELGAAGDREMVFHDTLTQVEAPDGSVFTVYTDIERLGRHMKQLSPSDATLIDDYIGAARRFARIDLFSLMAMPPLQAACRALPVAGAFMKWSKVTLEKFAAGFRDPFLRRAFPTVQYDFANIPMFLHLSFLTACQNHTLGWPNGGSLSLARSIASRYEQLGGKIHYRARVSDILVEVDQAVGVFASGEQHRADYVISAADGHSTVFELLGGKFIDDRIKRYYQAAPGRIDMAVQIAFGVARDMSREPHALTWFLPEPVTIIDEPLDRIDIEVYNFDDTLAPQGKTVVKVMLNASYDQWRQLLDRGRARYDELIRAAPRRRLRSEEARREGGITQMAYLYTERIQAVAGREV